MHLTYAGVGRGRDLTTTMYGQEPIMGSWGPFLETPDNFSGPVRIFSSSFICQLMVIIGENLAICFTKL